MEPFAVDFAMQRGHEMLITREPPFMRADMDEIDLHMLQAETIPRLLRVDWLEVDGCFQLRYSLTGKRMLSQRLAAQPLGMDDYYALLLGVIEALDECRHYLLRESCCLLDERYLFIGEQWSDVRVAYVPLRDGCMKQSTSEALLGLAARWGARVADVDGSGLQAVLKLLENPASTLPVIRNSLLECMSGSRSAGRSHHSNPKQTGAGSRPGLPPAGMKGAGRRGIDAAASTNPLAPKSGYDGTAGAMEEERSADVASKQAKHGEQQMELLVPLHTEPTGFLDREWRTEGGIRADASRAKWMSGALALLVCACCWRFVYMPQPGMETLLICIGLSLLLLWGVITLWSKLGRTNEPLRSIPLDELDAGQGGGDPSWGLKSQPQRLLQFSAARRKRGLEQEAGPEAGPRPARTVSGASEAEKDFDRDEIRHDEHGPPEPSASLWETGFLTAAASDETALLGDSSAAARTAEEGWLMREHRGHTLRIPLQAGISVIGRSTDIAHIVDVAEGVSRTHLEIEWDDGRVKVRDLASRNGSSLNGAAMVPYKLYELQREDRIRLAGTEGPVYTLHMSGR